MFQHVSCFIDVYLYTLQNSKSYEEYGQELANDNDAVVLVQQVTPHTDRTHVVLRLIEHTLSIKHLLFLS